MDNSSCSLSCTWMTIIDCLFMLLAAYLEMFHGSILLIASCVGLHLNKNFAFVRGKYSGNSVDFRLFVVDLQCTVTKSLTICRTVDFSIKVYTTKPGWYIVYFQVSHVIPPLPTLA